MCAVQIVVGAEAVLVVMRLLRLWEVHTWCRADAESLAVVMRMGVRPRTAFAVLWSRPDLQVGFKRTLVYPQLRSLPLRLSAVHVMWRVGVWSLY